MRYVTTKDFGLEKFLGYKVNLLRKWEIEC